MQAAIDALLKTMPDRERKVDGDSDAAEAAQLPANRPHRRSRQDRLRVSPWSPWSPVRSNPAPQLRCETSGAAGPRACSSSGRMARTPLNGICSEQHGDSPARRPPRLPRGLSCQRRFRGRAPLVRCWVLGSSGSAWAMLRRQAARRAVAAGSGALLGQADSARGFRPGRGQTRA